MVSNTFENIKCPVRLVPFLWDPMQDIGVKEWRVGWRTLRKNIFEENISFDRRLQVAVIWKQPSETS